MLQIVLGIAILVISLGVVYGGYRYAQIGKAKFADAGVKVNFSRTPAAYGFAPGVMGTLIILVGICGMVWGLILL